MTQRRTFLSTLSGTLAALAWPSAERHTRAATSDARRSNDNCWLDVAAPFVLQDAGAGLQSELVLTSDTFAGINGHQEGAFASEYEISLYDATGKPLGPDGFTKRLSVPAMHPAAIPVQELIGKARSFLGGVKIRLRPLGKELPHASDLFSSAYVRWHSQSTFDNVHGNPDPRQWQNTEQFFYSMPFPALSEYECVLSLFNPNTTRSAGELVLYDPQGKRFSTQAYDLNPRASLFFDLNARRFTKDPLTPAKGAAKAPSTHGLLAVTNALNTSKSFGYMLIRQPARQRLSVEHPIHQSLFTPKPAAAPFDAKDQFKAQGVLYSPLLFKAKRFGELTLSSRFYLGAGLPLEKTQWVYPFAVDGAGQAVWSAQADAKLAQALPGQSERGVLKLTSGQSCRLDFEELSLPANFAGGLALAIAPKINHTMMKVEVRVHEWDAFAFTHFRPGLASARLYQQSKPRGGIATDYIASAARLLKSATQVKLDELIGVLNLDDQGLEARPALEIFNSRGLVKRLALGTIPPFACRHFLLSELLPGEANYEMLTLRLIDESATLLMSVAHLDHQRRDLALDHGSDRFSTFNDFHCQ
jgi:hypothetical protein